MIVASTSAARVVCVVCIAALERGLLAQQSLRPPCHRLKKCRLRIYSSHRSIKRTPRRQDTCWGFDTQPMRWGAQGNRTSIRRLQGWCPGFAWPSQNESIAPAYERTPDDPADGDALGCTPLCASRARMHTLLITRVLPAHVRHRLNVPHPQARAPDARAFGLAPVRRSATEADVPCLRTAPGHSGNGDSLPQ